MVPTPRPLPEPFLAELAAHEEVLVTSRGPGERGTVPVWYVAAPPGVLYLFGMSYAVRARRWRADPWVRLTVPGTRCSTEGVVHFVAAEAIDDALAERVVEKWAMAGAPTAAGLRRTVRDGVHVLVRVEGSVH
jgi:hypothetical protein